MRLKPLGNTGLLVSEFCFGTATFGDWEPWAIGDDKVAATRLLSRAIEAGINFIDTADVYAAGQAEELVGHALREIKLDRSEIVISTKAGARSGKGPNETGCTFARLVSGLKGSLRRLGVDHVDFFQVHVSDPLTPVEETMQALDHIVKQGLSRYVGVSNWAAWKVMKANGYAEQRGLARLEAVQAYYSLAGRDIERELIPLLRDQKMGLLVWGPLAAGLLTGKFDRRNECSGARRSMVSIPIVDETRAFDCVGVMRSIAQKYDSTVPRVALAWLLAQPAVTSVLVGVRTLAQLDDNLGAVSLRLTPDDLNALNAVSELPPEYPGWYLAIQDADRIPSKWQSEER